MKKDLWKIMVLVLLGILTCQVQVLGCYPLVAAYFMAVYMEDFYRGALVLFTYLWLVMWLPITQLGKYGVILLVGMVAVAFSERMYQTCRKLYGSVMIALITVTVSFGGQAFTQQSRYQVWFIVFEAMMSFALTLFINREAGLFIAWSPLGKRSREIKNRVETPAYYESYVKALGELSETFTRISQNGERDKNQPMEQLQRQLEVKLCNSCGQCAVCWDNQNKMPYLLGELWRSFEGRGQMDPELTRQLEEECMKAKELVAELVVIFQRVNLNTAWYHRLIENREMIAGQLDAMSYALENCINRDVCVDQQQQGRLMKLAYYVKEQGVQAQQIHLYEGEHGMRRVTMELKSRWGNCVPVKEILPILSRCGLGDMISGANNRNIIGQERFHYEFITRPKLAVVHGVARLIQEGQEISGDNFSLLTREDGKVMAALSDGMGCGYQASRESETVIELMEHFVSAGFSIPVALRLMNAAMIFNGDEDRYSTLDVCMIDCYSQVAEFYKVGAHVSYIKHKEQVEVVAAESLPIGAGLQLDTSPWRNHIENGDYLVMVTDGVLEYLHVFNPVETVRDMISCMTNQEPEHFATGILERVLLYTGGRVMDDMTVLVVKAQEK